MKKKFMRQGSKVKFLVLRNQFSKKFQIDLKNQSLNNKLI